MDVFFSLIFLLMFSYVNIFLGAEEEGGRNDVLGNVDNLEADEVYNKNGGA